MTESPCAAAIQQALLAFERKEQVWCMPFVDALESQCEGSAIKWCVESIVQTVARDATGDDARTVVELNHLLDQTGTAAELIERSRDIWYSRQVRGDLQTATAKAYEAVAAYRNRDMQRYKRAIAFTVSEIVLAGIKSATGDRMVAVIEAFTRTCAQSPE